MVDYVEARLAFTQKDWSECARRFEAVRPSLIVMPQLLKQADLNLGYCYGQLHSVDQEISAYQRVLKVDPFNPSARQGLTDAYQASGRVDEAVQQWAMLIKTQKAAAHRSNYLREPLNQAKPGTRRQGAKVGSSRGRP